MADLTELLLNKEKLLLLLVKQVFGFSLTFNKLFDFAIFSGVPFTNINRT